MEFTQLSDGRISCPFDHHSKGFATHYFETFDEMRAHGPLVWSDMHGGFWIALSHALVRRLAMDSATFSVAQGPDRVGGISIPARPGAKLRPLFVPGEAEGQDHDNYRLALNPFFSRQHVAEMRPMIERHVNAAIDGILALGEFDVVHDFVVPLLAGMACEHLGIEVDEPAAFFVDLSGIVSYFGAPGGLDDVRHRFEAAWELVCSTVADRRQAPRADVISHLARHSDPAFTDEEIRSMTLNVVLGSSDTTSALIGQAVMFLQEHPDVRARLAGDPDLIRPAVEEFLRLFAVTMGPGRTVTTDIEVEGVTLRKGDRIMLAYAAANHDPAKYPDPYGFDLDRGSALHLAMGVGTHFCLGAHLAKATAEIALRKLFERVPDFGADPSRSRSNEDKNALNHWDRIPAWVR
jgi:cytochrome P450